MLHIRDVLNTPGIELKGYNSEWVVYINTKIHMFDLETGLKHECSV